MLDKKLWLVIGLVLLLAGLAACGGAQPEVMEVEVTRVVSEVVTETELEETGADLSAVGSEEGGGSPFDPGGDAKVVGTGSGAGWVDESAAPGAAGERAAAVEEEGAAVDMAAAPAAVGEVAATVEESAGAPVENLPPGSALTAGDVDDNARWDDYLLYRRNYAGPAVLEADVAERHQIWVRDGNGFPVLGALLRVTAGGELLTTLRTHSDGRAYFFPRTVTPAGLQVDTYEVEITAGGQAQLLSIPAGGSQREWEVTAGGAAPPAETRLDVLFLIDTTGSMADEIQQLKDNIRLIAQRIDALPARPDVRYAMTVYRDRGDVYTSRTFEFTPDVSFFAEGLAQVEADGGGDYPEDLHEGLHKAVRVPEWRVEETVSLIFLVADAPPQLGYGDQEFDYVSEMQAAAGRGIKIYPIASSGLDEQGEYIFRQLAQYTGGRFLFLTYGAAGAGSTGTETTMTVDEYDVTSLDGLVMKIVEEELAYRVP